MAAFRDGLSTADLERLRTTPVARLATVRPDRTPHLVPITFALDEGALVTAVDAKPKRTTDLQRLRNIRVQPAVSVLLDGYADDWARLWWIRIDGEAQVLEDSPVQRRAIDALAAKYGQYRDRPPDGPVIVVRPARLTVWHASADDADEASR
jgi:PPOX class probable F420-dependent enzyme